jgi:hypothetical protein
MGMKHHGSSVKIPNHGVGETKAAKHQAQIRPLGRGGTKIVVLPNGPKHEEDHEGAVPHFVPYLGNKPQQVGTISSASVGQGTAKRFNALAANRTPYPLSLDGLLISGFQVQVLGGSRFRHEHLKSHVPSLKGVHSYPNAKSL